MFLIADKNFLLEYTMLGVIFGLTQRPITF